MNSTDDYYRALVSGRMRGPWPSIQRAMLWAASVPYGFATRLRNQLYDSGWQRGRRVSVPVISVGNLTLGGTGKTPCVEYIARFYRDLNRRVVILSRGYGTTVGPNDEALVLQANLPDVPHLQGRDRAALALRSVAEYGAEVLILDDGFQHRRLVRDLDIVLLDATEPWGHARLFPRGLLREVPAGLRRAHLVMLSRCDQVRETERGRLREEAMRMANGAPVIETVHRPVEFIDADGRIEALEGLKAGPVIAFCGIGNPEAFRATLIHLGATVRGFRVFPDHHRYSKSDIDALHSWAQEHPTGCRVVTTQKDLVKLRLLRLADRALWALRIHLEVERGQELLDRKLKEALRERMDSLCEVR